MWPAPWTGRPHSHSPLGDGDVAAAEGGEADGDECGGDRGQDQQRRALKAPPGTRGMWVNGEMSSSDWLSWSAAPIWPSSTHSDSAAQPMAGRQPWQQPEHGHRERGQHPDRGQLHQRAGEAPRGTSRPTSPVLGAVDQARRRCRSTAMTTVGPSTAKTRWLAAHRIRLTPVASTRLAAQRRLLGAHPQRGRDPVRGNGDRARGPGCRR